MMNSRTANSKRNIFWGAVQKVVAMFAPFAVRTIMIKTLGAEYLGISGLFTSVLSTLSLAELGIGTAIVYSMYKPIADGNTSAVCALLNMYRKIYRIIGGIVFAIGIILIPLLPNLINGEIPADVNIYLIFAIYLFNSTASYWLFAYKISLLNAHQRADIVNKIDIFLMLGLYLAEILTLLVFQNYYCYAVLLPVYTILRNYIASNCVKREFPNLQPKGKVDANTLRTLKKSISGLMITKVSSVSRNAFASIIVSMFLGLTTVAIYNNYYYILNSVTALLLVLTSSIAASIGNSVASETIEKNYSDMNKLNFIYMWISGWCAVCLLCMYQPFMKLWVGTDLMFSDGIMWLFPLYFIVMKIGDIKAQYLDATGLWWYRKWYCLAEAIGNIILNFVFGYLWGVGGILCATIITVFVFDFVLSSKVIFRHYFTTGYIKYIASQSYYLIVTFIVSVVTFTACKKIACFLRNDWLKLIFVALICVILPNILFFISYCWTRVFKDSKKWLLERFIIKNRSKSRGN